MKICISNSPVAKSCLFHSFNFAFACIQNRFRCEFASENSQQFLDTQSIVSHLLHTFSVESLINKIIEIIVHIRATQLMLQGSTVIVTATHE